MKKLIAIPLLLLIAVTKGQVMDSTKYFVTEARINNVNYSEDYYKSGQYLTFYDDEDGNTYFLNSMGNKEQYSYGRIFGFKIEKTEIDHCPAHDITFRWFYQNSYDTDLGYAMVHLKRIYRENGVEFAIKILSKKLDIIEFSGFTSENLLKLKEEDENDFKKSGYLNTIYL
jgi:hypothetical protein